jgi:hypothetical protein
MAVTPNYSWPVPVATDFVKDGWEAISDLGNAIDTTVAGLGSSPIVALIPTSVAVGSGTGSFNATTGNVTFTGATSISVNGVFSATYNKYVVILNAGVTTNNNVDFRLRTSGSDNTTANYATAIGRSTSAGTFAQVTSSESAGAVSQIMRFDSTNGNYQNYLKVEILNPFQSLVCNGIIDYTLPHPISTFIQRHVGAFTFNATTSFDGFTFYSASALTGTLKVMAYV